MTLAEQTEIGAGASGRNSGAVQHPFDPALAPLHEETLAIYRELEAPGTDAFPLDRPPDGLLSVAADPAPLEAFAADVRARSCRSSTRSCSRPPSWPSSSPRSRPGLHGCRTETAWAVPPAAADAGARRARPRRGRPLRRLARVVRARRRRHAGHGRARGRPASSTPPGGWQPIEPVWGVVAEVELERPPRHVLEEAGIPELADALGAGEAVPQLFSLVSSDGRHGLGSSFTHEQPDERATARGARRAREAASSAASARCARRARARGPSRPTGAR